MSGELIIGFKMYDVVEVMGSLATVLKIKVRDFCIKHSSKEEMKIFIVKTIRDYSAHKNLIFKTMIEVCPQYETMVPEIEKLLVIA